MLEISYPVDKGIVKNWDDMQHLWDYTLKKLVVSGSPMPNTAHAQYGAPVPRQQTPLITATESHSRRGFSSDTVTLPTG
jgi:actin-related protein